MMYTPNQWEIVEVGGTHPHYRIFGSWSGGYLDGDSWRLNSGVTSCEVDGDYYLFHGNTGSIYKCHKEAYGIRSPYNAAKLREIVELSHGTAETLPFLPDNVENLPW